MKERDNSQSTYRERSPVPRIDELYEGDAGQGSRVQRRETLRDARQITTDQILDETRGRLSPGGVAGGNFYGRDEKPLRQNTDRIWPDEPAQPLRYVNDMYGGFNSRFNSDIDKCVTLLAFGFCHMRIELTSQAPDRYNHENRDSQYVPRAMSEKGKHDMATQPRGMMSKPDLLPGQGYGDEDEVDWDDDDAFDMSTRDLPSNASRVYGVAPQQKAYRKDKRYGGDRRRQDEEDRRRRENKKSRKVPLPQPAPYQDFKTDGLFPQKAPSQPRSHGDYSGGPNSETGYMNRSVQNEQRNESSNRKANDPISNPRRVTPETVYDLRNYDAYITDLHNKLPRHQAYRSGNGKAGPHIYGSEQGQDLGLCFVTFCTPGWCEMGVKCAWRHHPLTKAEREWIYQGRQRGKLFLSNLAKYWGTPEIPVPGANIHDKWAEGQKQAALARR
jgi:hypothetical protein